MRAWSGRALLPLLLGAITGLVAVEDPAGLHAEIAGLHAEIAELRSRQRELARAIGDGPGLQSARAACRLARAEHDAAMAGHPPLAAARAAVDVARARLEAAIQEAVRDGPDWQALQDALRRAEAECDALRYRRDELDLQLRHPGSPLCRAAPIPQTVLAPAGPEEHHLRALHRFTVERRRALEALIALGDRATKAAELDAARQVQVLEEAARAPVIAAAQALAASRQQALAELPEAAALLARQDTVAAEIARLEDLCQLLDSLADRRDAQLPALPEDAALAAAEQAWLALATGPDATALATVRAAYDQVLADTVLALDDYRSSAEANARAWQAWEQDCDALALALALALPVAELRTGLVARRQTQATLQAVDAALRERRIVIPELDAAWHRHAEAVTAHAAGRFRHPDAARRFVALEIARQQQAEARAARRCDDPGHRCLEDLAVRLQQELHSRRWEQEQLQLRLAHPAATLLARIELQPAVQAATLALEAARRDQRAAREAPELAEARTVLARAQAERALRRQRLGAELGHPEAVQAALQAALALPATPGRAPPATVTDAGPEALALLREDQVLDDRLRRAEGELRRLTRSVRNLRRGTLREDDGLSALRQELGGAQAKVADLLQGSPFLELRQAIKSSERQLAEQRQQALSADAAYGRLGQRLEALQSRLEDAERAATAIPPSSPPAPAADTAP